MMNSSSNRVGTGRFGAVYDQNIVTPNTSSTKMKNGANKSPKYNVRGKMSSNSKPGSPATSNVKSSKSNI